MPLKYQGPQDREIRIPKFSRGGNDSARAEMRRSTTIRAIANDAHRSETLFRPSTGGMGGAATEPIMGVRRLTRDKGPMLGRDVVALKPAQQALKLLRGGFGARAALYHPLPPGPPAHLPRGR